MGKAVLGIYDRDANYGKRLGAYIRRKAGDLVEVHIFTKEETFRRCMAGEGLELALVSVDMLEYCRSFEAVWTGVLSGDEREYEGENGYVVDSAAAASMIRERSCTEEQCPFISRYQSAEAIWQEVMALAGERILKGKGRLRDLSEMILIGIASPIHRIRKTGFAYAFGKVLAGKMIGRVLVLSLDEFPEPELMSHPYEDPVGGDLSELFYYYSQGQLTSGRICMTTGEYGGADFIRPPRVPEDLYRNKEPYPVDFFHQLAAVGGYRFVVIDVGNCLAFRSALLAACSTVLIPSSGKSNEDARIQLFEEWMLRCDAEGKQVPVRLSEGMPSFELERIAVAALSECRICF